MSLLADGTNYLLQPNGGPAVELSYGGAPVVANLLSLADGRPIAAAQTASGYEVAWKIPERRSVSDLGHRQQRQLPLERIRLARVGRPARNRSRPVSTMT